MEQDRIQFANNLDFNIPNMAKEICITHYFNELMAFYDLISLDQSSGHEGIKKFWFENGGHDVALNIEFGKKEKLAKFCNQLEKSLFIVYIMDYHLNQKKICVS